MTADLRARVVALEQWRVQKDIDSARNDEKWTAMETRIDARFAGLEKSVLDIQGTLSRINWLIIGGITMAVVAFLVGGGFAPG
ncbi:MAG: hypothetical protein KF849_18540 [Rhizobiaceae bacterium]|nr:hypothetical protein [Rhizobiaceae bacterium]